jgi:DNA primase
VPVTKRQIALLAPYLVGDKPTHRNQDGTREWHLRCPLHPDEKRSASLNVDKGVFYCFKCGGLPITALIRQQPDWLDLNQRQNGSKPDLSGEPTNKPRRRLTEGLIGGWHSALMSSPEALQWLFERRGINLETVEAYELGYRDGRIFTIPVRSESGEIWNVRYYDPRPDKGGTKIWGETGYNSPPRLYPIQVLNASPDSVLISEGEWDCLLALQNGYQAVTRTASAMTWHYDWNEWFKDRTVFLVPDRDKDG